MSAIAAVENQGLFHAQSAAPGTPREVLSFKLGQEEHGIDILRVQEVLEYEPPSRIANAPLFMKGVVNLRGVIVPIVDLRLRFGLPDANDDGFAVVIILNIGNRAVGVVVDSVSDVLELKADQIRPATEFNSIFEASDITGLGSVKTGEGERLLIVMDIEAMMRSAEKRLMDPMLH